MGKIKRSQVAMFLNTGSGASPTWSLIGEGVTEQTIAYNPQTSDEVYIHQDSGTTDVESYKVNIPTPMTAIKGDQVFDFVDEIRKQRKVLADARSEICIVYLYETPTGGAYEAERNACSIQVDDFGGPGGESAKLNFTINLIGNPVLGTFDPSTKTFTPAEGSGE